MQIRLLYILLVVTIFFLACSREIPAVPSCRINPSYTIDNPAPAACLIKLDGKLVALQSNHKDLWWLPQQRRQKSLSAQCTAHQAAWKNTGLNVEVGQLFYVDEQNTHFYHCALTDSFSQSLQTLDVPPWATRSVTKVALVDPFATQGNDWVKPLNIIDIRQAFSQIESNVQQPVTNPPI